jgi:hypothetical protein
VSEVARRGPFKVLCSALAVALLLSGCAVRRSLPEGSEGMKCARGHDEWNQRGTAEEIEFVCDEWVRDE